MGVPEGDDIAGRLDAESARPLSAWETWTPGHPATELGGASGTSGAGAGPGRAHAASPIRAGKNSLFSASPKSPA